jgi:hypothetical protein
VWRAGLPLHLTVRELDLLLFWLDHPGQVFSRDELMRRVWGWSFGDESTVTVHVRRLREKVEPDPSRPVGWSPCGAPATGGTHVRPDQLAVLGIAVGCVVVVGSVGFVLMHRLRHKSLALQVC